MLTKKSRIICSIALALSVFILSACQPSPTQDIITSKDDDSFDINTLESIPNTKSGNAEDVTIPLNESDRKPESEASVFQWQSEFSSTDGSVIFITNIQQEIPSSGLPVVEVAPHFWTEEDARQISKALFGDCVFYEAPPKLGELEDIFTKEELQKAVQRWSVYTNEQALLELFPKMSARKDRMDLYLNRVKDEVTNCGTMLEGMPDTSLYGEAKWEFQPEWKYIYPEDSVPEEFRTDADGNEQIFVTTTVDDIPYQMIVTAYKGSEYKLNTLFVYPDSVYSPVGIDRDIFRAQLCRTNKPSAEQIENVKKNAEDMLNRMAVGEWAVEECYLENTNPEGIPEYVIHMNATPVFEGVAAMYRTQLDNFSENYAPSYYLTEAAMQFSANGDLVSLQLSSPLDVVRVASQDTAVMAIDELMEKAETYLTLSDYYAYGLSGELLESYQESAGEKLRCNIELNRLDYGLIRVKAAESNDNYYYIPGIILSGSFDYCGQDSGTVNESSGDSFGAKQTIPIVAINALDGSVIDLSKG